MFLFFILVRAYIDFSLSTIVHVLTLHTLRNNNNNYCFRKYLFTLNSLREKIRLFLLISARRIRENRTPLKLEISKSRKYAGKKRSSFVYNSIRSPSFLTEKKEIYTNVVTKYNKAKNSNARNARVTRRRSRQKVALGGFFSFFSTFYCVRESVFFF